MIGSADYFNKGARVTAVGILNGDVHRCVVVRQHGRNLLLQTVDVRESRRWVTPDEEGTIWARGWKTKDAVAFRALVALEQST